MPNRMNYYHICRICRREFTGFIRQHTCWSCIAQQLPEIMNQAQQYPQYPEEVRRDAIKRILKLREGESKGGQSARSRDDSKKNE